MAAPAEKAPRTIRHSCAPFLSGAPIIGRPCCACAFLGRSPATLKRLRQDEKLPCVIMAKGPGGEKTGRRNAMIGFRLSELQAWIEGRRETQILRTVNGERFTRRRPA